MNLLILILLAGHITRHDPNIPCQQIKVDYTSHPLYGADCNEIPYWIEKVQGGSWVTEFAKYWLNCHPYEDPLQYMDVNMDGVTNFKDWAILSKCTLWYKTNTGKAYHTRGCRYLRTSCIVIQDPNGLSPCRWCVVPYLFLK